MQYIKLKYQTDEVDLFPDDDMDGDIQPISYEDYKEISFVCLRANGSLELPSTLGIVCRKIAQKLVDLTQEEVKKFSI